MNNKRSRGRPVSPSTIERRRIEELLRSPPEHIPRMTEAERAEVDASIAAGERIRKQILKDYKHGATTPNAHAYDMASLGDESVIGHEQEVLNRDHNYKSIADEARRKSRKEKIQSTNKQATQVCEHFRDLLSRAVPLGPLSRSEVARKMLSRWPSDGRLGNPPTDKTLKNWIERSSPFPAHKIGKVSLDKK